MLSNSSKYAIKAVLHLALHSNEETKLKAKDIAAHTNVPLSYLSKLLQKLAKANKITSERGPHGGFYLKEEDKNQNLNEIIEVLDTQESINTCVLGFKACDQEKKCLLHDIFSETKNTLMTNLKSKSINDLINDI